MAQNKGVKVSTVHDLLRRSYNAVKMMMLLLTVFLAWPSSNVAVQAFTTPAAPTHKRLHLLTFDLDDTIFPIGPVVAEANDAMISRLQTFGYTDANNDEIVAASKRIRTELREAGEALTYTDLRKQSIRREIMRLTDLQHHQVDDSIVEDVFDSWLSTRHASADKHLFSDCVDALEAIQIQHPDAIIGAITNGRGNPLFMPSVKDFFHFCVSGEDEGVFPKRKPDKGIYEAALETFYNLRKEESPDSLNWIHVGDDLANDVGAAAITGAKSIWLSAEEEESDLPSWSTATKEEMERRAMLNDSAKKYVSSKISSLNELESAVMHILTGER
eukprot:scaffold37781_cov198-Skeletonema_marinoi.AAC.4